jgi:NAD(P)-dependent dehydrogenase (short-subunit alcohol dehydrogenase family)
VDHFDLSRKVAVVAGSSGRIGRLIGRILAPGGAKDTVTSRKIEPCVWADGGAL